MEHKVYFFTGKFECGYCGAQFPMYYANRRLKERGSDYWGNRGRYNFAGARSNFNRHTASCKRKADGHVPA